MLAAEQILRTLEEEAVDYVLIGAFAATIHGSALRTEDVDVCPSGDALTEQAKILDCTLRRGRIRSGIGLKRESGHTQ